VQLKDFDILVVGYPGQLDVFPARLLAWLRKKPLVWDIFMSIYLIALERGLEGKSRLTINGLRWIEKMACRLPDRLILDTREYARWFDETHGVPLSRFRFVPTGADDRVFLPASVPIKVDNFFHVIYYGTFIPNHGVIYIIEEARLLQKDPAIQFELIGDGPELETAVQLVEQYGLSNVTFVKWLEQQYVAQRVIQADVCLGAFGITPQSMMTIQNKIYEGLAMAKPVITGDSPAVRESFEDGISICLVERTNPGALAEAITRLKSDPDLRTMLATNGHSLFLENYSIAHLGILFKQHLLELSS
jgi:glycosyltransferase involved in cell wall biosynthesis